MGTPYNSLAVTYESLTEQYNGTTSIYTYSGSVEIKLLPSATEVYNDGADVFSYVGSVEFSLNANGEYFEPTSFEYSGDVSFALGMPSTILIRKYYKFKDPVVFAGCPSCGTYLYNK